MTTVTFATAGTSTWTCPAGVSSALVECWGAGGGGGSATGGSDSGGGGGAYAAAEVTGLLATSGYSVVVGAGGTGGGAGANSGRAGGASSFGASAVVAAGGAGGTPAAVQAPGGTTAASTGTTLFAGGAGGLSAASGSGSGGGGGGGSAGPASAGNAGGNGSGSTAGAGATAVTGGGPGGPGGHGPLVSGSAPGSGPGGGGGGGQVNQTAAGNGFAGQVRITYTPDVIVTAQPGAVTVTAPPGTITTSLNFPGPAAGVTVTAPPGTVTGSTTLVSGPAAQVQVVMPPGIAHGPPVTVSGPAAQVQAGAFAGTVTISSGAAQSTASAVASLLINSQIELLGGGVPSAIPACAGAYFRLGSGYDFGVPQPIIDITSELVLNGERPFGRRSGNRTFVLPVKIIVPPTGNPIADIATLSAARETLLQLIDPQTFTLTWTRDGGLPLVFDCFRALPAQVTYALSHDRQQACEIQVSFQALPYGRSDIPVQLSFASPATDSPPPPPAPVTLDSYEAVSGQDWTPSPYRITGATSAHWNAPYGINEAAVYTRSLASVSLQGRTVLQHWAGFASPDAYWHWIYYGMAVSFTYVLRDSSGRTLQFGKNVSSVVPATGQVPNWYRVSTNIPQGEYFDYSQVVSYTITVTNHGGTNLNYTDAYLDELTAQPLTTAGTPASIRGAVYTLHGIQGTSPAPIALKFQQPASTAPVTVVLSGSGYWLCPAGVTGISVQAVGGGGAGASLTAAGHGGGGGGGAYAAETALGVTPGGSYFYSAGAGGTPGSSPVNGGLTFFSSDTVTVSALGGVSAAQNSATGAAGGAAGSDTVAYAGGSGAAGSAAGGGGGAAGSASGTGPSGSGAAGGNGPLGDGGAGGAGNAAGSPGTAPGGGGGGANGTSGTHAGGAGAAGTIVITYTVQQPPFKTLIAHRPGPDAPVNLTPFVSTASVTDPPDGRQYPVVSQVPGVNARFNGTYTVVLVANSWASPSAARTVYVNVYETAYPGGPQTYQQATRTLTPSTDVENGIAVIGEITLPGSDVPPDNTAMFHTLSIYSTNQSDQFLDVCLLDTQGQTVLVNTTGSYSTYYLDEPDSTRDIGRILGSTLDRTQAISVLQDTFVSGGPLTADVGDCQLFCYAVEGAPALLATYSPRWTLDRLS